MSTSYFLRLSLNNHAVAFITMHQVYMPVHSNILSVLSYPALPPPVLSSLPSLLHATLLPYPLLLATFRSFSPILSLNSHIIPPLSHS